MNERKIAMELAREAGQIIRAAWGKGNLVLERKSPMEVVTQVDKQCEALITSGLQKAFPGCGILAEEGGGKASSNGARWIIDPLDGTTNFTRAYPLCAVSIGLQKEGELVLGVVYNPISDELFVAERGAGAVLNGVSIHVSACTEISEAVIGSGFPYDAWQNQDDNTREWAAMTRRAFSVRCDGAAAMDLCQVACGRLDGYWEKGLQPWDMAAGIVIVREAGGWVSDYRLGNEILERSELICGNKTLVNNMLAVIQK